MSVYDKAHELTKALQDSEEAKELSAALQAARSNPEAKRMMDDFRGKQSVLQQKMAAGEQPSPSDVEMMDSLYKQVNQNPLLQRAFDAERKFSVVFEDVTRIVTESLRDIME
ncbi:YlbF family regulator [Paenibacillus nasutitermitis]|uniref:UPF0342 protein n=1 Tax=Paenibacillus nasutitermitis TaxID=1652958 RepID=A0A917DV61_9BACL|nr:YlbF family regulator [Paenibacillus nasutitermitis]GGD74185.1 UPF0342 protein [Paenibacillus nasutitermitis]